MRRVCRYGSVQETLLLRLTRQVGLIQDHYVRDTDGSVRMVTANMGKGIRVFGGG